MTEKILLMVWLVVCLICKGAYAGEAPASAEQLRAEFETALKARDTNAVLSMVNWKGVSDKMKSSVSRQMRYMIGKDTASVKLLPVPTGRQFTNELSGVRYFPNVHILGLIDVESTANGNATQMPYGESGGKFYFAGVVEEVFDPSAKKAVPLAVSVMVFFSQDKPGIFECSYVYVANGKEKADSFQCTNTWNKSFWGDYIKSSKVTKISGAGTYELIIMEEGKTIFDSHMVETNESIVYARKNP